MPGSPKRNCDHENVPHSPESAMSFGPRTVDKRSVMRRMFMVNESLAIDISGPGAWPPAILAMARRLV
jgi:hypothetical protein